MNHVIESKQNNWQFELAITKTRAKLGLPGTTFHHYSINFLVISPD